jgi:ketosteroid isomerase-like protein
MARENVEIIRRSYDELARTGDFDTELFAPEFEFDNSNAKLDAAVYRGLDGLREFLSLMRDMWKQMRFEPEEYIPVDENRVVVPVRITVVGRDGLETAARSAHLVTIRNSRVARMKAFQTKADALEAAGLTDSLRPRNSGALGH